MALAGEAGIGRVVFHPSRFPPAPGAHPGMHRIRPLEARFAGRRIGAQEAADIARRDAERAQAGDHGVGEVLADAPPAPEGLQRRRVHFSRLRVERHVPMQRQPDRFHRLRRARARRQDRARIVREFRFRRQARRGGEEMVRRIRGERADRGHVLRQPGRGRRVGQRAPPRLPAHAGGQRIDDLLMRTGEGQVRRHVPEEVPPVAALGGRRRGIDGGRHDLLPVGEGRRQQAERLAAGRRRGVVMLADRQRDIVEHRHGAQVR